MALPGLARFSAGQLAACALALSVLAHFALQLVPRTTTLIDLRVYRHAPPGLLDGSLYEFRLGEFSEQFPLPFTYPPFAALVFLPLAYLPWLVVRFGWHLLSLACLYWIVRCSVRLVAGAGLLREPDAELAARLNRHALLWTALAVWIEPVRTTFNYGQINLVLIAVLLSAMVAGRDVLAGLGIGLAAGVKLTPAICGLYFLVRRRFAAAAWSAGWFFATVGLTFAVAAEPSRQYWQHLLGDAGRIGPVGSAINQSLRGALSRSFGYDVALGPPWLVAALLAAALSAVALRVTVRAGDTMASILVVQFFGLLVSPISWSHHWVWVVPALIWLAHGPVRRRIAARASGLLWLLLVGSYLIPLLVVAQPTTWTIPRPWYLAASGWAYPVAAVLLLAAMVWTMRAWPAGTVPPGAPAQPADSVSTVSMTSSMDLASSTSLAVMPPAERA